MRIRREWSERPAIATFKICLTRRLGNNLLRLLSGGILSWTVCIERPIIVSLTRSILGRDLTWLLAWLMAWSMICSGLSLWNWALNLVRSKTSIGGSSARSVLFVYLATLFLGRATSLIGCSIMGTGVLELRTSTWPSPRTIGWVKWKDRRIGSC